MAREETIYTMDLTEDDRPHVKVLAADKLMLGLLDSGASISILGSKGLELLSENIEIYQDESPVVLKTADGTTHLVSTFANIPFKFNNKEHILKTLIASNITKPLILGMDFWRIFGIRPVVCDSIEVPKISPVDIEHTLSPEQAEQLKEVVESFKKTTDGELSFTTLTQHDIDTGDALPIRQKPYIVSPYIAEELQEETRRLLKYGIIEKSYCPEWLNPIIAVRKPTGKIRICVDARKLNEATRKNAYPPQNVNRILGLLRGTKYLSAIDLTDAYYQVQLTESSRQKTSFAVPGMGTFKYKRMPMGLCNSGATLCELIDRIFMDLQPYCFPYLDDFIIATDTFDRHMEILKQVSERLAEAKLTISPTKSRFCMKKLRYLGYVLDEKGLRADPAKIRPILEYAVPKNVKATRRLLGLGNWYRRFIKNYSEITAPISDLLRKPKKKFNWTAEAQDAFMKLKTALTTAPVLSMPDYSRTFYIHADASDIGMGSSLNQIDDNGDEKVIAYMSKKFTDAQKKYFCTERECLAVLTSIEYYRQYIQGVHFKVITDHAALLWLQNLRDPTGRLARWALRLQQYDFQILHRKGSLHVVPDALSRAIDLVDTSEKPMEQDPWYTSIVDKITQDPNSDQTFRLENDRLYKLVASNQKHNPEAWKIVVPKPELIKVLEENHDSPLAAHPGTFKTINRIKEKYFWPRMTKDITTYVTKCETCKAAKAANGIQRTEMGKYRDAKQPWRILALDFIGPKTPSARQNKWLLVAIDMFSKYVLLRPMKTASAEATVKFLKEEVFLRYGTPEFLINDNGSQMKAKGYKEMLEQFRITPWKTAYNHPQANCTEAVNKSIGNCLRVYLHGLKNQKSWDAQLPELASAINTCIHSQSLFTPHEINFGNSLVTSGDQYKDVEDINAPLRPALEERVRVIRREVQKNLKESYEKNKKRYDLRSRVRQFNVGDIVWRKNFKLSNKANQFNAKLGDKYVKCIVQEKIGTNTYKVKDFDGPYIGIFNIKDIKS